ncbi:MAG: amidohydrolase family protein, partial [Deltaproteobacteria bacterium]|nr:amidohydrolase family protein [Deltaproteobacteria bacterium]
MQVKQCYIGFPPLPGTDEMVEALVHDPPDHRWRIVRDLFRIDDQEESRELIARLRPYLDSVQDFRIRYRIVIALQALHHQDRTEDYVLVRGRGVFHTDEVESWEDKSRPLPSPQPELTFSPVTDFHIHPKLPDLKFLADLRQAGVAHAVILATDTDPGDLDRPEIVEELRKAYSACAQSHLVPFEKMLVQIRASLYSATHVTNQDVADWVEDYPDILFGFGSVNLSKDRAYVEEKLDEIIRLKLRGVKLLPYSQFFNPSENENVDLLFDYCRQTGTVVLSHTGCGAGPFEIPELSRNAHPGLWEPIVKKYPSVPLVLAHCGAYSSYIPGIWLQEALELGKKYRNVFADLAAVDWILDREMVVKEIRKTIGFHKILFATDYPLPLSSGVSLAYLVSAIKANIHLTEKE